jgi:glutathione S-transferase
MGAAAMKIYGDMNSGNCLKVKWVCDRLKLPYQWIEIDTRKGETRTPQFLEMNGAGQVPTVAFDDGRTLAQSNAIIRYLARDSDLIPRDPFAAAKMDEWLFWEQYSHEPYVAVCRFQMVYLGKAAHAQQPRRCATLLQAARICAESCRHDCSFLMHLRADVASPAKSRRASDPVKS